MKEGSKGNYGKHLRIAIDYILRKEDTKNGALVGALNCSLQHPYEQMKRTKALFHKEKKRQGYHIILSFQEGEITPERALDFMAEFANAYIGKAYEAVYSVHDNTEHVHGHLIFNSVSFLDGKKFRYEKGDWAKYMQPITNGLCENYGLSTIKLENEQELNHSKSSLVSYPKWREEKEVAPIWNTMIRRDFDACILQAGSYDDFLELMKEKHYEIKVGKYLSVKPQGMKRFRRSKTLGEQYELERIKERILEEDLRMYAMLVRILGNHHIFNPVM